jgi:hypothetical protein
MRCSSRSLRPAKPIALLDVLPRAPGRAGRRLARAHGGATGRRRVALHQRDERHAGVSHRQLVVGPQGSGEGFLGAGAVGQELVHAVLEALDGDGGGRRDGQSVPVVDGHREASIAGP